MKEMKVSLKLPLIQPQKKYYHRIDLGLELCDTKALKKVWPVFFLHRIITDTEYIKKDLFSNLQVIIISLYFIFLL